MMMTNTPLISMISALSIFLVILPSPCASFTTAPSPAISKSCQSSNTIKSKRSCNTRFPPLNLLDQDDGVETSNNEVGKTTKNPLELASWYAVEAFGKAFGSKNTASNNDVGDIIGGSIDLTKPPSSLDETLKRIQLDNDRSYFLSGEVDRFIYDEECTFADPFVSFDGRDRFIDNLSNLGSFITNYDAKMIKYDVENDGRKIVTKVMVKLELNLPWKPVLAWPWGVTYVVDPDTFLVTTHEESWDIEPWDGVLQILRPPTVKISEKSSQ